MNIEKIVAKVGMKGMKVMTVEVHKWLVVESDGTITFKTSDCVEFIEEAMNKAYQQGIEDAYEDAAKVVNELV